MNDFKFESKDPVIPTKTAADDHAAIESIEFLVPVRIKFAGSLGHIEAHMDVVNRRVYFEGKQVSADFETKIFNHLHNVTTTVDSFEAPLEVYDKVEEAHGECLNLQQQEGQVE